MAHDRRACCFAYGRYSATTVVAGADIGDTTFDVADATNWATGRQAFCSESGGTETEYEWLGKVTDVDGTTMTITHGLTAAKSANWKVWTATYAVETSYPPSSFSSVPDPGVEDGQLLSGRYYPTQTRGSSVIWTLGWEALPSADVVNYRVLIPYLGAARCVQIAIWELEAAAPAVAWVQLLLPDPAYAPIDRDQMPLTVRAQYLSAVYQA